jgi:hypothetical protein
VRGQQEHLAGPNSDVYRLAVLNDFNGYRALDLPEELLTGIHVVVFAGVGATHYHHDKIFIILEHLLVAYRGLQQVAVFINPLLNIERPGYHELRDESVKRWKRKT